MTELNEVPRLAYDLALDYELKYYGCSQSTMAALLEAFKIDKPGLLRASTAFAGGTIRKLKMCGSLISGLMFVGYFSGRDDLTAFNQYSRGMEYAEKLYQRFLSEFGTDNCKEIQTNNFGKYFDLEKEEDRVAIHEVMEKAPRGCQHVCATGALIASEIVIEILRLGPPLSRTKTPVYSHNRS